MRRVSRFAFRVLSFEFSSLPRLHRQPRHMRLAFKPNPVASPPGHRPPRVRRPNSFLPMFVHYLLQRMGA